MVCDFTLIFDYCSHSVGPEWELIAGGAWLTGQFEPEMKLSRENSLMQHGTG
jgi:hypothetical protein